MLLLTRRFCGRVASPADTPRESAHCQCNSRAQIAHQLSIRKASVCQETDWNADWKESRCPFQHRLINTLSARYYCHVESLARARGIARPRYWMDNRIRQYSSQSIEVSSIKVISVVPQFTRADAIPGTVYCRCTLMRGLCNHRLKRR